MKRFSIYLLMLSMMMPAVMLTAQDVLLSEDFDYGIPDVFRNIDGDGCTVDKGFRISVSGNWFPGWVYASQGKVAMSTSHHVEDAPADNWLVTPQMHITSPETYVFWDAKSCHHDLPESYSILVSTTDDNPSSFVQIARVDGENYQWTHRMVSLAAYEGQDVYVAIRHESRAAFILAIDNLYIGTPREVRLVAENTSRYFCGDTGVHPVTGSVSNLGASVNVRQWVCVSGVGEYTQTQAPGLFATGDRVDFRFEIPVRVGETSHYQIFAETDGGERISVLRDSVVCSYFPRTLLVEKGTGVWCTACPSVMASINAMKDRYRDEMVLVESHSAYNDYAHLSCLEYDEGMSTYNYPVIYYNREHAFPQYSASSRLAEVITKPTMAQAKLEVCQSGRDSISVRSMVTFAEDLDNGADRYRLGFAVVEREMRLLANLQKNNCTQLSHEEYGMMSSPIISEWMFFHNTVRSSEDAFAGIEGSVPGDIQGGQSYTYMTALPIPSNMNDCGQLSVIAYVLDCMTGVVMNTCIADLDYDPTVGINAVSSDDAFQFNQTADGCLIVPSQPFPYRIYVYNVAGQILASYPGVSFAPTAVPLPQGVLCLVKVVQNGNNAAKWFIRR